MSFPKIGPYREVYQDKVQKIFHVAADFGDFTKEYFVRDVGQRAGVVVVAEEAVLLVRQYRLLIDGLSWEIPGGKVDDGETPDLAAARECLEETGVRCGPLKPLLSFLPGLDITYNPSHLFYTEESSETGETHSDPGEVVTHHWVPLERCINMIRSGEIYDSFSMVGLLSYSAFKGK